MDDVPQRNPPAAPEEPPVPIPGQDARIAFLMFADRAEVLFDKLYVMGGLFDTITVQAEPATATIGVALGVEVPWNAANEPLNIAVIFEDSDGRELGRISVEMTVGRPPHLRRGSLQRVPFAIPQINLPLPQAGEYVARTTLNGADGPRMPYRVLRQGQ